jgi:hypothetical protein
MSINGRYLTARTSESHKTASASSLSDILEDNPDPKYFLSQKAVEGMVYKIEKHRMKGNGFEDRIYQQQSTQTIGKEQDQPDK